MYNLADLFLEKGLQRKAIPLLEKSVGIALDEINSSFVQEEIVLQKTNFYIKIFERLADCYVKIGRTKEALKVLESIKLASLRLRTLSVTDRPKRQKLFIKTFFFLMIF